MDGAAPNPAAPGLATRSRACVHTHLLQPYTNISTYGRTRPLPTSMIASLTTSTRKHYQHHGGDNNSVRSLCSSVRTGVELRRDSDDGVMLALEEVLDMEMADHVLQKRWAIDAAVASRNSRQVLVCPMLMIGVTFRATSEPG